ncbi:chaperone modulator CbpM [Solimicrobium silvestre]|uniref:MerR HTH family regulatory protein n=1 Tax=Solimicrobium silvestre TaxID=2099400 RepID=A0A2S9GW36_9BURK|nr:chaperone modulator CbpM [Solimicrobium silvestre]PRC91933.1 MerR HTH family regulatory protein [Solimicrobium silvestre]
MSTNISECIWLSDHDVCSANHLIAVSGLSAEEFDELVQIGIITPINDSKYYRLSYIVTANTARRLRDDFELDLHGMGLAMTLMLRIENLQAELNNARARIPASIRPY